MISYIRGILAESGTEEIVIEAGGIGYGIKVPASIHNQLPARGMEVKVFTYLQVREDAVGLFGFLTRDDLEIFRMLLGVSGIGPKGALNILSAITPDDLRFAILSDDAASIAKAPGIGRKTAQKVILELKDKMKLDDAFEKKLASGQLNDSLIPSAGDSRQERLRDAAMALSSLGYTNQEALKAVSSVETEEDLPVEELIRRALKTLAR